jgi:hypothetical protein
MSVQFKVQLVQITKFSLEVIAICIQFLKLGMSVQFKVQLVQITNLYCNCVLNGIDLDCDVTDFGCIPDAPFNLAPPSPNLVMCPDFSSQLSHYLA